MTRPPTPEAFTIALDLLSDTPAGLAWSNLGDWSTTGDSALDYPTACRQLALRVGRAAALQPGDAVLDLACGHGASLALWPEVFGVRQITGLDVQAHCVERIRQQPPAHLDAIVQGRFDTLPPPAALAARRFDAALCVDAAYHAQSLDAFAALAAHLLRPQGRLAFTTLVRPPAPARRLARPSPAKPPRAQIGQAGQSQALRFALSRAGIPSASVLTADDMTAVLARQGFRDVQVEILDAAVLAGFHAFVQRRGAELPWARKAGAGWLKIQATAWLCRYLHQSGALHYALVRASRAGRPLPRDPRTRQD